MVSYEEHINESDPNDVKLFFYPIDEEGTVLPGADFSREDVWNYFMIFARDASPAGTIGMPYGDVRITEALRLCEFLQPQRDAFQLQEITVQHDNLASGASPWILTVSTRDRTRQIIWGHAPRGRGHWRAPCRGEAATHGGVAQTTADSPGEVHRIDLLSPTSTATTPVSRRQ
ncbi:MAG: hypothetical protein R3C56_41245 [Pirellulaceae bacterium]